MGAGGDCPPVPPYVRAKGRVFDPHMRLTTNFLGVAFVFWLSLESRRRPLVARRLVGTATTTHPTIAAHADKTERS